MAAVIRSNQANQTQSHTRNRLRGHRHGHGGRGRRRRSIVAVVDDATLAMLDAVAARPRRRVVEQIHADAMAFVARRRARLTNPYTKALAISLVPSSSS